MRKKMFVCLALCLTLFATLSLGAYAQNSGATQLGYVTDAAGLLTEEQRLELENQATAISESYGCGVYIVTVADMRELNAYSAGEAAEMIYGGYDLGLGAAKNGVMLFLSMAERDYYLLAYGSVAHTAFTDYGKDTLEDCFLDDFKYDDWYAGFKDFVSECGRYLELSKQGTPVDVGSEPIDPLAKALFVIIPPSVIALIVCLIFKSQMKTARLQTEARNYVGNGGVDMRVVQDHFTHRTQTVQIIQTDNDNSHGGGGTTINAQGFSGRGGKF